MPKVGKGKGAKHFSYGPAGMAAAEKYAAETGQPIQKKAKKAAKKSRRM